MASISPVFFIHGGRVVRGSIKRRSTQHRMKVQALNYVLPDGSDQPIPLDFNRVLGHEEIFSRADELLALLPKPKRQKRSA